MQALAVLKTPSLALAALLLLLLLARAEAQGSVLAVPAGSEGLNITTPVDDYVIDKRRQHAANIRAMDAQLAEVKTRYEHQLKVIIQQTAYLGVQQQQVEDKLLPLELIGDLSKHCVQKYYGQLATAASVQSQIGTCVASATSAYAGLVSSPTNTRNYLNNWYNGQFANLIRECKRKHTSSQLNYTICATQAVATGDSMTASYKKNFDTQLVSSSCAAEGRVKQAVDCSFTVVYATTSTIGQVLYQIDRCSQGLDTCHCASAADSDPPTYAPNVTSHTMRTT